MPGCANATLDAFDTIRVDCLNGDKYKTGKTTPDGKPDPSIFSTPGAPVGIQVGTAIATLIRKAGHAPAESVGFRHLWGQTKRDRTERQSEESEPESTLYDHLSIQCLELGLPFAPKWRSTWAMERIGRSLPDLFPKSHLQAPKQTGTRFLDKHRYSPAQEASSNRRLLQYWTLSQDEIARRKYPVSHGVPSGRF